jgi:HlyD family secretion protein
LRIFVTTVTRALAACSYKKPRELKLATPQIANMGCNMRSYWMTKTAMLGAKVLLTAAALVATASGSEPVAPTYQGWVEANFVFIGPDESGRVEKLSVREGDAVADGAPLFTVDADLQKAAVVQNEATLANARETFNRAQQLLKTGSGTKKEFDAAQAALTEAEARLNSLQTKLARRSVFSPASATIQQVYFRPGEVVAAGHPVVSLLPPGNIKLRFFVPQAMLPQIRLGDAVRARCDGCLGEINATISFISDTAEYTPPVIYSLEERAKLVFLVEARPQHPDSVRVGQPVRVTIAKQEAAS